MKLKLPALLAATVAMGAVAVAADTTDNTPSTSVTVTGTRVKYDVPTTPAKSPEKPDFTLNLPAYQLDSLDFNFPSGMRVIFQADHSQPVVAITMVMDRGSTSDPIGKEGIAHFVEHLWFRSEHKDRTDPQGEKRLPKTWDILTDLGCDLNASTSDDWTNYMTVCPASSLQAMLRLEMLRIAEPIEGVKEEVVDTEREVIRNELRMRYENTWMQVFPYLFDRLYPKDHPYARLGIGTHESLLNCHLADIQKFTETNYKPENATIVVVGDFDLDKVPQLIADNFDPALVADPAHPDAPVQLVEPKKRVSGPAAEPPPPADQSMGTYEYAGEDPMVVVAWSVPGAYHGQDWDLRLMASIAGNFMNQYFRDHPENHVKGRDVGCFLWDSKVDSKVMCALPLTTADVNPDQIAQRAADQIAGMTNPELSQYLDIELSQVRMSQLADILRSLDLFSEVGEGSRATTIAHWAHFTGSHTYHSDAMNEVMKVNATSIKDYAYKYLKRERMVNVFLKPLPKDKLAMDAAQSTTYVAAQGGDDVLRSTIDPKMITPEVIKDFTITPNIDLIIDKKLPNGLRIVALSHGEAPLVEAGLVFGGGTATAPLGMDNFADEFSRTVWNDSGRRSDPLRIAGTWGFKKTDNYSYDYIQSSSGNLDGALWLLREAVENFTAITDGKVDWANTSQDHLKKDWKYRDGYYGTGFVSAARWNMVNPGHPLAFHNGWEDFDRYKSLGASDIMDYVKRKYQPANATLLIVGNVDAESAERLAEYYLQGWEAAPGVEIGPLPGNVPANPATTAPVVQIYDDPGKTQTDVTYMCPLVPATTSNDAARRVLGDYLDEQAWIILRENGGVTYGANAFAQGYEGGSSFLWMGSLVQNEGTALAVQTFEQLAKDAESGVFKDDRVAIHKLNIGKKYVLHQQSVPQMRDRLLQPLYWRNDWSTVTGYSDRLAAVTPASMQALMGDCTKHWIITVEGPKDAVTPSLDKAGIAYEVVDWKQEGKDLLKQYDPAAFKKAEKADAKAKAKEAKEKAEGGDAGSTSSTGTTTTSGGMMLLP
jgi:zinc protease